MSRKEFKALKVGIQKFQFDQYPGLSHSIVNHQSTRTQRSLHEKSIEAYMDEKTFVRETLQNYDPFHPENASILEEKGLTTYYRNQRVQGVIFKGRKYRFKTLGIDRLEQSRSSLLNQSLSQ